MATIPGSVRVGGFIAPSDSTDEYATQDSIYGRGGLREVADFTALNAITTDRRRAGMLVFVNSETKYYRLLAGPWDGTLGDWVEYNTSGTPGPKLTFDQATPLAVWTITHNFGTYPAVTVVDSAKTVVDVEIAYPDANTVTITASSPFAGTAFLY